MITNPEKYPYLMVRLRPYEPKVGQTVQQFRFRVHPQKSEFLVFNKPGEWAKVDTEVAMKMAKCRQQSNNPLSPPVFDICTPEEAMAIDRAAKVERERMRAIVEPSVETARDLTSESGRGDVSLSDVASRNEALNRFDSEMKSVEKKVLVVELKKSDIEPNPSWLKRDLIMYARKRGIKVDTRYNKNQILEKIAEKNTEDNSDS